MSESTRLRRALLASFGLLLALAAAAFWPAARWQPPARPALKAPIVFDELAVHAAPPSNATPTDGVTSPSR